MSQSKRNVARVTSWSYRRGGHRCRKTVGINSNSSRHISKVNLGRGTCISKSKRAYVDTCNVIGPHFAMKTTFSFLFPLTLLFLYNTAPLPNVYYNHFHAGPLIIICNPPLSRSFKKLVLSEKGAVYPTLSTISSKKENSFIHSFFLIEGAD